MYCFSYLYVVILCIHPDLHHSSLHTFFGNGYSEKVQKFYKNTTRADLDKVHFSFHEDNQRTTQGVPCPRSFPLTFFLLINLGVWQLSINDASRLHDITLVISLTFGLSSWKEKFTLGKSTLVVFL